MPRPRTPSASSMTPSRRSRGCPTARASPPASPRRQSGSSWSSSDGRPLRTETRVGLRGPRRALHHKGTKTQRGRGETGAPGCSMSGSPQPRRLDNRPRSSSIRPMVDPESRPALTDTKLLVTSSRLSLSYPEADFLAGAAGLTYVLLRVLSNRLCSSRCT